MPETPGSAPLDGAAGPRPRPRAAFAALLLRDLVVLRKTLREFIPRTILQPLLLVFVFTYVFPKIGQGIGGGGGPRPSSRRCSSPASSPSSILFQGIQSVSLPMVQEFGYTREIEDRVLAPMPVWLVAIEKVAAGRCSTACSPALIVFPIAAIVPATPVHLARELARAAHARAARVLRGVAAGPHVRHALRPAARCRCCSGSS